MAKTTVYVPDELWRRVQQLHDDINISQIFQGGLEAELRRRRRQEHAELDALIDVQTLRQEFARERKELFQTGYKMGVTKHWTYADLRFCADCGWERATIIQHLHGYWFQDFALVEAAMKQTFGDKGDGIDPVLLDNPEVAGATNEIIDGVIAGMRRVWELAVAEEGGAERQPRREKQEEPSEPQASLQQERAGNGS
jgi:hypothetical protein